MATLFTEIAASRTATDAPLTGNLALDLFSNDWSVLSIISDLVLAADTLPSSVTSWATIHKVWLELPAFAVDSTFGDLELVVVLNVEAKCSANPDANLRLTNDDESLVSNTVEITDTTYAQQDDMTLVFTAGNVPTGQVELLIQTMWDADPGGETVYVKRTLYLSDCAVYLRLAT